MSGAADRRSRNPSLVPASRTGELRRPLLGFPDPLPAPPPRTGGLGRPSLTTRAAINPRGGLAGTRGSVRPASAPRADSPLRPRPGAGGSAASVATPPRRSVGFLDTTPPRHSVGFEYTTPPPRASDDSQRRGTPKAGDAVPLGERVRAAQLVADQWQDTRGPEKSQLARGAAGFGVIYGDKIKEPGSASTRDKTSAVGFSATVGALEQTPGERVKGTRIVTAIHRGGGWWGRHTSEKAKRDAEASELGVNRDRTHMDLLTQEPDLISDLSSLEKRKRDYMREGKTTRANKYNGEMSDIIKKLDYLKKLESDFEARFIAADRRRDEDAPRRRLHFVRSVQERQTEEDFEICPFFWKKDPWESRFGEKPRGTWGGINPSLPPPDKNYFTTHRSMGKLMDGTNMPSGESYDTIADALRIELGAHVNRVLENIYEKTPGTSSEKQAAKMEAKPRVMQSELEKDMIKLQKKTGIKFSRVYIPLILEGGKEIPFFDGFDFPGPELTGMVTQAGGKQTAYDRLRTLSTTQPKAGEPRHPLFGKTLKNYVYCTLPFYVYGGKKYPVVKGKDIEKFVNERNLNRSRLSRGSITPGGTILAKSLSPAQQEQLQRAQKRYDDHAREIDTVRGTGRPGDDIWVERQLAKNAANAANVLTTVEDLRSMPIGRGDAHSGKPRRMRGPQCSFYFLNP